MKKILAFVSVWLLGMSMVLGQNNSVVFDNQSGEPALVKLIGPTSKQVEVPTGTKVGTAVSAGQYTIKVRYGIAGRYHYSKGDAFEVKETTTAKSETTITLHKVLSGNYNSKDITKEAFDASDNRLAEKSKGQSAQECRFAVKDRQNREYELYLTDSESLRFETADSVVDVKLANISSLQITQDAKGQMECCITLRDGKTLANLHPNKPHLQATGWVLVAGIVGDVSVALPWEIIREMKRLDWRAPQEDSFWQLHESGYSTPTIRFRNNPILIPATKIGRVVKGDLDTRLSRFAAGNTIKVAQYLIPELATVNLWVKPFRVKVPISRISRISFVKNEMILRNSQKLEFDSVEPIDPYETNILHAMTPIGKCIFRVKDIESIEFTGTLMPWEDVPNKDLIVYNVTNRAKKTYRAKHVKAIFLVVHTDVEGRCLSGKLQDDYYVDKGASGDRISYRDFRAETTDQVPLQVGGALLLADLGCLERLTVNDESGKEILLDFGKGRILTASFRTIWTIALEFKDMSTGDTITMKEPELLSVQRLIRKNVAY